MSDALATWSAVALAVVFAAWRFAVLAGAAINVAAATAMLVKLADAGNLDRARKLCRAAPRSPYLIALGEALVGDGESREVRRARFDDAFGRAMASLEGGRWMDLVALGAGMAAAIIAATSPTTPIPAIALGAAAALIALRNRRSVRRMRSDSLAAVPGVLDAVTVSPADPAPLAERVSSGDGVPVASRAAPPPPAPPARPAPPAPPPAAAPAPLLDLREGSCPICGGREIAERPAVTGDLVPWVCQGCGYAQLFAPRG